MKKNSKSILYNVKERDKTIPYELLKEKCRIVLYKLSYFTDVKLSLRYDTKDFKTVTLFSIDNVSSALTDIVSLSNYIVDRILLGIPDDINNIVKFYLYYTYTK